MVTMNRSVWFLAVSLAVATFAGGSGASTAASSLEAASLARYEAAAGEPVDNFRLFKLDGYTVLGDKAVAVWATPRRAWLVTLATSCNDIDRSLTLDTSSLPHHVVFKRNDVVRSCRVDTIRPVDVAALRESERASGAEISVAQR